MGSHEVYCGSSGVIINDTDDIEGRNIAILVILVRRPPRKFQDIQSNEGSERQFDGN